MSHSVSTHSRQLRKPTALANQFGQGMAEYLIIVIVVGIVVLVAIRYFGSSVHNKFSDTTGTVADLRDGGRTGEFNTSGATAVSEGPRASTPTTASAGDDSSADGDTAGAAGEGTASVRGGGGSAEQGSDDALTKQVNTLSSEREEVEPIEEIQLDWTTLALLGGIVIAGCLYFLFKRFGKKKGDGKKKKKKKKVTLAPGSSPAGNDGGQAMTEFVLVVVTFLFCILGVIQLALAINAYTMVRYAAYNAARAGIVHGGDQQMMEEAARISLLAIFPRHGRADHRRGMTENYLAASVVDSSGTIAGNDITYYGEPITSVGIIDNHGLAGGQVVTFDDPEDAPRATITVEVTHLYELVIPVVNRMLFWAYVRWREFGGYQNENLNYILSETHRLRQAGGDFFDIEYRVPIVAHYTMHLQSDYVRE